MTTIKEIPAFVISLADEKERRARIEKILNELGIAFTFIDAVDGRQFDVLTHPLYDAPARLRRFGKHMNGGEIGCLLSHKKTYQYIVDNNIAKALIFEDDVVLKDGFVEVVTALLSSAVPYDMVRFFGSPKLERLKMRGLCKLTPTHTLTRHSGMPGGSHATLTTTAGAQKLLAHLNHTPYPIDALMGRSWLTGIDWYTVRPGVAAQDLSFDSAIGDARFDRAQDTTGLTRIFYPLTRAWFKFSESVCKKFWYYKMAFKDKKYKDG